MPQQITVGQMFELTRQTFGQHFPYLIALAGIFIALTMVVGAAFASISANISPLSFVLLFTLVMLVIYAKLAVMIHRLVILDEKGLGLVFKWSATELKFITLLLLIVIAAYGMLYIVLQMFAATANSSLLILMIPVMAFLGYLFARVSLIFPATAAGHKLTFQGAWEVTAKHKLLLFFLIIVVPYITGRIVGVIPEEKLFWSLISGVISVFVGIFEVGLLSHCYEAMVQPAKDDTMTAAETNREF